MDRSDPPPTSEQNAQGLRPITAVVGRVAVFVFAERSDVLRAAVSDFEQEAREHSVLRNPSVSWDSAAERLVLEVDVTAEDREIFGLEGYAEFMADQAFKIATGALPLEVGEGGVRVLSAHPSAQS